ncbi:MAG: bifunctional UDP-N-acetylglucosamine diphosphorylase/glucosamine-1-phosphate N-acetyltransferase GlmU [Caldilineaceae bacterium]|nr:bifunctional UDP-N-acetylglucosamine diphosphorylase/glucosamine-1-phosphate N-acetyltransferase GlmU [Caldilineaceae bacterium]HRJ41666.1 bifunctional UDP-N-acetylglucosamine diphosphorylase/glucosamine-1-phosphate N-acetyltransferase GlmU [Caldilineaceae bacterium]
MTTATVILAAGFGTRMKSELPKVLHPLAGRPLVEWVVRTGESIGDRRPVVVVGHGKEQVQALLGERVEYAEQKDLLGTGHAVMQATPFLIGQADRVVVLYSDMPLLREATLQQLLELYQQNEPQGDLAVAMLTIVRDDPQGFGRVVRDGAGQIQSIVEELDCSPAQKLIRELNPGIYCFNGAWLWENLPKLKQSPKGEYYLTDMIEIATSQGQRVVGMQAPLEDVFGINDRIHLAVAATALRQRINQAHMGAGVTIVDPATTYIEATVEIGQDTTIYPGCHLKGKTVIGRGCQIGPNSQIEESLIGDDCRVLYSVLEYARMDRASEIGPFGHLRKGAHLGEEVHMGNFGEVKNSYLGPGTKMGHFSYVGDATIGRNVNVSAGIITCNYDGKHKNHTELGDDVFLGSDTLLVAPVTLGPGARTGAGSVVTRDVPAGALVYGVPARPPIPKRDPD